MVNFVVREENHQRGRLSRPRKRPVIIERKTTKTTEEEGERVSVEKKDNACQGPRGEAEFTKKADPGVLQNLHGRKGFQLNRKRGGQVGKGNEKRGRV